MAHDISIKLEAIKLRQAGYSIKEIAKKLNIAQSSSSVWLRNIKISESGFANMKKKQAAKSFQDVSIVDQKTSKPRSVI